MRRYLRSFASDEPAAAWGLTRAMMIRRILTICAAVTASAAWAASASAQAQSYPVQSYTPPPGAASYPPDGAPADYRRAPGVPDFDSLDDEEPQGSTALSPPGPVLSPDDPRYGRPMGAPVYSDRNAPTGPVLSPDDPRYGRPMGAPSLFRPQRADRPDPVARRSTLWPAQWSAAGDLFGSQWPAAG